jgi:hypothetical protein
MYAKIFNKPSTLFVIIQRLHVSASMFTPSSDKFERDVRRDLHVFFSIAGCGLNLLSVRFD